MHYIDLHTHSQCSDGTMSPAELIREAVKENIKAISITDHDTAEGTQEALFEGEKRGVEVLSGVEISAFLHDIPMHILGYGFACNNEKFQQQLKRVQKARNERNLSIINKLVDLGFDIQAEELKKYSPTGQTGRPHIASLLVEKKIVKNMDEAFSRFLRKDGLAYVARKKLLADDAINMIRSAGGIAVLAHPLTLDRSMSILPAVLQELIKLGLEGIEAYYPIHSKNIRRNLIDLAEQFGLIITGGSDYHGTIRNGTRLGGNNKQQRVPYDLYTHLTERLSGIALNLSN